MTSRRGFLRGTLGLAAIGALGLGTAGSLVGCDAASGTDDDAPHELDALLLATVELGERYAAVIAAVPALANSLRPIREAHQAHAEALAGAIGSALPQVTPNTGETPTGRAEALTMLTRMEKTAHDEAITACLATSARLAPLVGSIAAARASHLEVLP